MGAARVDEPVAAIDSLGTIPDSESAVMNGTQPAKLEDAVPAYPIEPMFDTTSSTGLGTLATMMCDSVPDETLDCLMEWRSTQDSAGPIRCTGAVLRIGRGWT